MTAKRPTAAVTGAAGYLGSRICEALMMSGWQVIKLTRPSSKNNVSIFPYELDKPISPEVLEALTSVNLLIHAAYDMSVVNAADIWRVNVEGTGRLLEAAASAEVGRIIVLSSMSAFEGTPQLYGRSKLEIEAMTIAVGGCVVRPGLVYGKEPGGMAGTLKKLANLPIVPVIAGGSGVYAVSEDDLMKTILRLAIADTLPSGAISVAHPKRVMLKELLRTLATEEGRSCHAVPVPWRLVYLTLKASESFAIHLPFRADSVLGLVYTAPTLSGVEQLSNLGVALRPFSADRRPVRNLRCESCK